jgi:hypothetical protein
MAAGLIEVLTDDGTRHRLAGEALARSGLFSAERWVTRHVEVYGALAASRRDRTLRPSPPRR